MEKIIKLSIIITILISILFPSYTLASSDSATNLEVKDVIKEKFEIPIIEGLETIGYSVHDSILTYFTDGSFDLEDKVITFDLDGNVIDEYIETSSARVESNFKISSNNSFEKINGNLLISSEKVKNEEIVESYNSSIYIPSQKELSMMLEQARIDLDKNQLKKEMEDLLGKDVTSEMFLTEQQAQEKLQELIPSTNDKQLMKAVRQGYGNNYYTYNINSLGYSIQTLSGSPFVYFLVSDNRSNLSSPQNWSDAMSKMDNYSQSLVFMESKKDLPRVTDWLDVVASWLAVYGIAAGPKGWSAAAVATIISALNSIYNLWFSTGNQEAVEAKFASTMLNDLSTFMAWGYVISDKGHMWFVDIPDTTRGHIY